MKDVSNLLLNLFQRVMHPGLLEDDEEILKIFRRSFPRAMTKVVGFFGGGFAASYAIWWFFYPDNPLYQLLWIPLGFGIYKGLFLFIYWYLNSIILTNTNIIFVEWERFFHRRVTRLDYWNLDEIQVSRTGLKAFLYSYGSLHFNKVNGGELFSFHKVTHPNRIAKAIEAMREEMVDNKNFTEESALKNLIGSMVQRHVDVHGQPVRKEEPTPPPPPEILKQVQDIKTKKETPLQKKIHHDMMHIEVEKRLDDEGGIEIDLDENHEE